MCDRSDVGLRLLEPENPVSGLPQAALFQKIHTLEALEDIAFHNDAGCSLETLVL